MKSRKSEVASIRYNSKSNKDHSALTKGKTKQREIITTHMHNNCDDDDIDDIVDDDSVDDDHTNQKQGTSVNDDISEESEENLSQYELAGKERIEHNKRKFEEIFGRSPKDKNFPQKKKLKTKKQEQKQISIIKKQLPLKGDMVAVRSDKYSEKPLIGQVTEVNKDDVTINWYIGTFSGYWKEWKGRQDGKSVIFSDTIPFKDILQSVSFTKTMKLPPKTVAALKELY